MDFENIKKYIENELDILFQSLNNRETFKSTTLLDGMRYAVVNGGKRLRPILTMLAGKTYNCTIKDSTYFALAIELVHAYSLVHDDMPCMDNDTLRRGKPTVHKAFGEDMGLLIGDGLLNLAMEILSKGCTESKSVKNYAKAMKYFFEQTGFLGMVGGQAIDIYTERVKPELLNKDSIIKMYEGKTSRLFKASVVSQAILGGANESEIKSIETFAENLGIAFQLQDDVLDETSSLQVLGKDIGSDKRNGKITILSLIGLDGVKKLAQEYTDKALESLKSLDGEFDDLIILSKSLLKRDY